MQNKPVIIIKILTTAKQLVSHCLSCLDSCLTCWPILSPCSFLLFHLSVYIHLPGFFLKGHLLLWACPIPCRRWSCPTTGATNGGKNYALKLLVDFGFKAIKDLCSARSAKMLGAARSCISGPYTDEFAVQVLLGFCWLISSSFYILPGRC